MIARLLAPFALIALLTPTHSAADADTIAAVDIPSVQRFSALQPYTGWNGQIWSVSADLNDQAEALTRFTRHKRFRLVAASKPDTELRHALLYFERINPRLNTARVLSWEERLTMARALFALKRAEEAGPPDTSVMPQLATKFMWLLGFGLLCIIMRKSVAKEPD